MNLNECIKRIENYLDSSDNHPRIINANSIESLKEIKKHFNVGENLFLDVESYSGKDKIPNVYELINDLMCKKGNLFVIEFTTILKLLGDAEVENFLNTILHESFRGKVIVLCYQCDRVLDNHDVRIANFVYRLDDEFSEVPEIILAKDAKLVPKNVEYIEGIENIGAAIEFQDNGCLYVLTTKNKESFKHTVFDIEELGSPFDIIKQFDNDTVKLEAEFATDEEWGALLEDIKEHESCYNLVQNNFGSVSGLENLIGNWRFYEEETQLKYFLALKVYGTKNTCLARAVEMSKQKEELERNIYNCLIDEDLENINDDYWKRYEQRKRLIKAIGNNSEELIKYCNLVQCKGKEYIYLLTDNTLLEKELMLKYLSTYGTKDNKEELVNVIKIIYPDLYSYLRKYDFKNDFLNDYFQEYKYQKLINKVFPEFIKKVEDQSVERDYNLLPPRVTKVNEISKEKCELYYVDALGVEFLAYIFDICQRNELTAKVDVCRCELPSLTSLNKEFIEEFSIAGAGIKGGNKGIKELDEIKHGGVLASNYETSNLPIHLIKELDCIKEIIETIATSLEHGSYNKAVVLSDHGASRLAVIYDSENKWAMNSKGEHSGRCCPINEIDEKPDFATEQNGYWVLANYDRFKGGRKSDVEVHGGATLEEVLVPVIQITKKDVNIEIKMMTEKIKFNIKDKNALIKFFSTKKLTDVTVELEGKMYPAETEDNQTFIVRFKELTKAKEYTINVYSSNNLIAEDISFVAEKEGFATRKLF